MTYVIRTKIIVLEKYHVCFSSIQDWQTGQQERERIHRYVWNQTEFDSVDPESTDYLLGMFNTLKQGVRCMLQRYTVQTKIRIHSMTQRMSVLMPERRIKHFLGTLGKRLSNIYKYNPFLVYCRELAPGTVSLTGDRAQDNDSKHDSHYS